MTIPNLEYYQGFYLAGDDDNILRKYWGVEINNKKSRKLVFKQCGGSGFSAGCGSCEHSDCTFSIFARMYRYYPIGD
jgi:hypothetical protein